MSFPNFSSVTLTISLTAAQTIPLLLATIAFEELALAHTINAEAEKTQFVLGTLTPARALTPPVVTLSNLLAVDASVQRTLRAVIMKEMLLEFQFENVLDLTDLPACSPISGAAFTNPQQIGVPPVGIDRASTVPYPSIITVTGLQGVISQVVVTINGFMDPGHSVTPFGHLQLVLVAPDTTTSVLLVSEAGNGAANTPPVTFTISDTAPGLIPSTGPIPNGTFQPTVRSGSNNNITPPAPQTAPYPATLSTFNGMDPNGTWSLYAHDPFVGHGMIINNGWTLTFDTTCP